MDKGMPPADFFGEEVAGEWLPRKKSVSKNSGVIGQPSMDWPIEAVPGRYSLQGVAPVPFNHATLRKIE